MEMGLAQKVALVTGAGSGIGKATALALGADGTKVVATDRDGEAAAATAAAVSAAGGQATSAVHDVTSLEEAHHAVRVAVDTFGGLDLLANVAGAWRPGLFVESTPEDWAFEVDICFYGVLNTTRAALEVMTERGGRIVNVASDAGRVGEFRQAVYSGAKAGVIGFSKALAREVGRHGITVNCVAPGFTRTPGTEGMLSEDQQAKAARAYPLGKLGTAVEVAPAIVFLLSDGASHITGQTISVSGGYSMV